VMSNNRWTVPLRYGGIDYLHTIRGLKLCDDLSNSLQKKKILVHLAPVALKLVKNKIHLLFLLRHRVNTRYTPYITLLSHILNI